VQKIKSKKNLKLGHCDKMKFKKTQKRLLCIDGVSQALIVSRFKYADLACLVGVSDD